MPARHERPHRSMLVAARKDALNFVLRWNLLHRTSEVCCLIDAAGSFVLGLRWIGADGARAVHCAVHGLVRRNYLSGSFALFHPLLDRADIIEIVRTHAAA